MAHNRIVNNLESRLRDSNKYDFIDSCKEFMVHGKYGECDLYAIRDNYGLVFEMKGRDRAKARKKARSQLQKDVEWLYDQYRHIDRIFCFYVYNEKRTDVIEWQRDI